MKPNCTKKTPIRLFTLLLLFVASFFQVKAQTETLPTGSFIINMGATNPNTIANGLKPYGLIYDLLKNNNVPIKWVIAAGKVKDGVDFTHNGVQYRGGTFIIPAGFRDAAVNARITFWQGQGVVGTTTTTPLTVTVTQTLVAAPKWTLDATNGPIAQGYLTNAGITNTGVTLGAYNYRDVRFLDCCDDFFVMPHADPTWATHNRLFSWNRDCLGTIWAACHAVSALENSINPGNTTQQMNFLSTRTTAVAPTPWPNNSLTLWGSHTDGSVPYTHQLFSDPVAQYLGTTDAAQTNGSEQIYLPKQGVAPNNTRWRPGVKIIAYDPTQANVPTPDLANGNVAAAIVYGRAFDDPARGLVMYEAGHSHDKGTAADVAAQRAFFNFSFLQVQPKAPQITVTGLVSGQNINSGSVTNVSVSATSPLAGITFSYLWTSTCGGTFANSTAASTTFTAPTVVSTTPCVLTCKVTDNCGRASFQSFPVTIVPPPVGPTANPDVASVSVTCGAGTSVTTNVLANDVTSGGLLLTLTNVTGAVNGTVSFTAAGNVTFTPNANFTGPLVLTYTVCNNATPTPLCSNSTLTISTTGGSTPAAAADAFTIAEDAVGRFNVLANDAGGLTVIGITAGPANGRVSINTDNTITYVPNADFGGPTDNFTYRVTNGTGGYNTATVTVTVTNDACNGGTYNPVLGSVNATLQGDNILWTGDTDKNYGDCNYSDIGGSVASDLGRLVINYTWAGIPGGATINSATLTMTTEEAVNAAEAQAFSVFRLTRAFTEGAGGCNGANNTVSNWLTASAGNNWTTVGGDFTGNPGSTAYATTTVVNGTAVNTAINWDVTNLVTEWHNGTFSNFGFLIKGSDASAEWINFYSKTGTTPPVLTINYSSCSAIPTRAPIAMPDTATTQNGVPVNIATVTNDFFPVAGAVTYSILTGPASGTASINASGVVTYTPATTFNGVRSLTYRVNHTASGLSDTATVYINITNGPIDAVNDAPAGALSGVVQTINVKANDTDPEGAVATATVTITTAPKNGTATVNGSNNIVYTPNVGFTGADTLFYSLCEPTPTCGSPLCDIARLIVTVTNRPPVANPVFRTILPCYANTFTLITSASDPEIGVLTISSLSALSNPAAGTLVNNNDGTVTFTPATGFVGVVTFTYTVTDDGVTPQVSAPATVTITVSNPPNNAPIANNDGDSINVNQILYYNVRDNDTDPDNHPLTIPTITIAPLHGTAVVNPINGQVEYTPNTGYVGPDTLSYRICDIPIIIVATCTSGPDLCDTARLAIRVVSPLVLPIKLISFIAQPQNSSVVLKWVVALETNVATYQIEYSANGRTYASIGSVTATGSRNYNLTHTAPKQGLNYYRLKTIDKDGKVSYSEVRTVNFGGVEGVVKIYPIPASATVNITVTNAMINQSGTISIIALDGRLVHAQTTTALSQTETINVSKLASGKYIVRIVTNNEVVNQRIEILR